ISDTLTTIAERDFETQTGETPYRAKELLRRLETALEGQTLSPDNGTIAESLELLLSPADLVFLFHTRENALRAGGDAPAEPQFGLEKRGIYADAVLVRLGDMLRERGWRAPFSFSFTFSLD